MMLKMMIREFNVERKMIEEKELIEYGKKRGWNGRGIKSQNKV